MSLTKRYCLPLQKCFLALLFFSLSLPLLAQKAKVDSLYRLMQDAENDTAKITLLWRMASAASIYNPDTAITLSYKAKRLAENIDYTEGVSRATGIMANSFMRIGNYPRALELNIDKLKIEESRNVPENMASVLMNIGIVYVLQDEYMKALPYYKKADSIIELHGIENLKYNIALNTGDLYDRLNRSDSAYKYFNKSLIKAKELKDDDLIGTSMVGLGHSNRKLYNIPVAKGYYLGAINYLNRAKDYEVLSEAALGLATLYKTIGIKDSARFYGKYAYDIASAGFLGNQLKAAEFLTNEYKQTNSFDSAFLYVDKVMQLNDSLNSKSNIRKSQIITSNEVFRQMEIAEQRLREEKERSTQLQLLLIAVFIPAFFIFTLLLSRVNISVKFIRVMGVLSLLFFFEFLTLFIHPTVAKITHHTPVLELIILVAIAAFIIPLHHRMEHWMINKLMTQHQKMPITKPAVKAKH